MTKTNLQDGKKKVDQLCTFEKGEKDEHHEVPAVLLYSLHLAPPRENESCIDETRGEAPRLHFLLARWLQRNNWSYWVHTEGALCRQGCRWAGELMAWRRTVPPY